MPLNRVPTRRVILTSPNLLLRPLPLEDQAGPVGQDLPVVLSVRQDLVHLRRPEDLANQSGLGVRADRAPREGRRNPAGQRGLAALVHPEGLADLLVRRVLLRQLALRDPERAARDRYRRTTRLLRFLKNRRGVLLGWQAW